MITVVLIVVGLCLGSFVNAFVWRLQQQGLPSKERAAKLAELSITKGRSMCPHCKHTLGGLDLIPLFSWLALRGRCRYCKEGIGWQYPLVEAVTAALFVASYFFWPFSLNGVLAVVAFCIWLAGLVLLMALTVYDIRWMLLPDKIVFPFIGLGVLYAVCTVASSGDYKQLLWVIVSVAIAGGIFYVLFQVSKGTWIGGGDVKMGYGLGLFLLKPSLAFLMLFLASLLGLLVAVPGLLTSKLGMTSKMPFGPFLIASTFIVMLFGQRIIDLYVSFIML